jgi:hypothetical protein
MAALVDQQRQWQTVTRAMDALWRRFDLQSPENA